MQTSTLPRSYSNRPSWWRLWRALLVLALLCCVPVALAVADDDDDDDDESVSYHAKIARAEALEYGDEFDDAAELREEALEEIDRRLEICAGHFETVDARIEEAGGTENLSEDERLFIEHWRLSVEDTQFRLERERVDNQRWLDMCQAEDGGDLPALRPSRRIVWSREEEMWDELAKCEKYEGKGKLERAHPKRRRVVIVARANRRFYEAKIEGLEHNLRLVERNRHTRDTDAPARVRAQIAYFEAVLEDANAIVDYYTVWRDATSDPQWNRDRARFWELVPEYGNAYGLAVNEATLEVAQEQIELCRARAEYYEAKAAGDEEEDGNGESD